MGGKYSAQWWEKIASINREISEGTTLQASLTISYRQRPVASPARTFLL
jgi:hypothetical protein